ncbi:MAG: diguanylate cyclase [Clostridia bacterium]|nr:diguanylate cyclase [Clostridia bacterium]
MNILLYIAIAGIFVILGILLDRLVTINAKKEHIEIKKQAFTDQLTGKGNRHKFVEDIERMISKNKKFAVCFMDLDGFKNINDTMGHDAGDLLLIELGKKLEENLPKTSESYRLGGDEFAILMQNVSTVEEITKQLDKLKKGLTDPVIIDGVKIVLEYSLGIAIYPTDAKNRSELMTYADDAMYYIKEHGKNDYYFHNDVLKAKLENKKKLELGLKEGVANNEFEVEYIPRIDLSNENICMEAKVVWVHPVLGRLEEEFFIKQAEEIGVISYIDEYVINKACEKISSFISSGTSNIKMFINIANLHVKRNDFIEKIAMIIKKYELPKGALELCFSQRLELKYLSSYKNFVVKMKEIGVNVSMSNLELRLDTLKTFKEIEIDSIKLDAGYEGKSSSFNNSILLDIIKVCKDLDYIVEIVGIEDKSQLAKVLYGGADYIQGKYLFTTLDDKGVDNYVQNFTTISEKVNKVINEVKK